MSRTHPRNFLLMLALSLGFVLSEPAAAQDDGLGLEKTVPFRVLIDASGKLTSVFPLDQKLGEDINRAAIGEAKALVFEPARVDGKPADTETYLSLIVRFLPQPGGGYKLALKSASLTTEVVTRAPLVFPRRADRKKSQGVVVLAVAVNPDGSVDGARTRVLQSVTNEAGKAFSKDFEQAVLDSVAKWTYKPDLVAGQPVATEARLVMRFCREDCSDPADPAPSAESKQLPRALSAGVVLARPPPAMVAAPTPSSGARPQRFRVAIDANGAVTSAKALGEGDAGLAELARQRLLGARFFPATVQGRAVASEMSVTVPVQVERGLPRLQFERLGYDLQLISDAWPWVPMSAARQRVDSRVRLHIVTGPDGRGDAKASKIESLELSPESPAIRRAFESNLRQSMARAKVEPVLIDGVGIPVEFNRSFTLCYDVPRGCKFQSLPNAADWEVKLPAGVVLARARP